MRYVVRPQGDTWCVWDTIANQPYGPFEYLTLGSAITQAEFVNAVHVRLNDTPRCWCGAEFDQRGVCPLNHKELEAR